jgi:hypothetical protein
MTGSNAVRCRTCTVSPTAEPHWDRASRRIPHHHKFISAHRVKIALASDQHRAFRHHDAFLRTPHDQTQRGSYCIRIGVPVRAVHPSVVKHTNFTHGTASGTRDLSICCRKTGLGDSVISRTLASASKLPLSFQCRIASCFVNHRQPAVTFHWFSCQKPKKW